MYGRALMRQHMTAVQEAYDFAAAADGGPVGVFVGQCTEPTHVVRLKACAQFGFVITTARVPGTGRMVWETTTEALKQPTVTT